MRRVVGDLIRTIASARGANWQSTQFAARQINGDVQYCNISLLGQCLHARANIISPRSFSWQKTSQTFPSYSPFRHGRYYNTLRYQYQLPSSCETAVRTLVGLNIAVFLGWKFAPQEFMAKHFLVSLQHIRAGYIQTLVTSCFSHKDVMHLLANMFTLYFFWNRGFSGKLVYFLYICGGLAGNLASLAEEYYRIASIFTNMRPSSKAAKVDHPTWTGSIKNPWARDVAIRRSPPALGASGSVNASVIFNILVSPQSTVLLYGIVPVPALLFGGLWIYYDIAGAMGGQQSPGPSGHFIGYTAHLGGATTGALTYLAYRRGLLRFVTR